jgi:hypothetical protein
MLEVQCDDTQIVAIFGKVVKCSWLAANRINGAADFGRKRTDVLGVISVLCWLGCLGVTALRLGYGNAAGDRKHTTQHKRTFSSETNRLENRRAKHECTQLAAELTGTLVCAYGQAVHRDAEPRIEQRVRGAKGSEASAHATSLASRADADLTWPHHRASEARLAIQDFVRRRLQASKSIIRSGHHVQVKIQPQRGTVLPRDRSDPGFKSRRHFPKVVTGRMSVPTPGISLLKPN